MKILKIIASFILGALCMTAAIQILLLVVVIIITPIGNTGEKLIRIIGQLSANIFFLALGIAGIRALRKSLKKASPDY